MIDLPAFDPAQALGALRERLAVARIRHGIRIADVVALAHYQRHTADTYFAGRPPADPLAVARFVLLLSVALDAMEGKGRDAFLAPLHRGQGEAGRAA